MVNIGEAFQLGGNKGIANVSAYQSIGNFINAVLGNVYVVTGLLLFFLILGAGFSIITAGDNPEQKGKGAKAATAAAIGFLIIFLSYWIIQIIEKITGANIFNPGV